MRSQSKKDPIMEAAAIINSAIKQTWGPGQKIVKGAEPLILQNISDLQGRLSPNGMKVLAKLFPQTIKPELAPTSAMPTQQFPGQMAPYAQPGININAPTTVQGGQGQSFQDLLAQKLPTMRPFNGNTQNVNIHTKQLQAPGTAPDMNTQPQVPMPQGEM